MLGVTVRIAGPEPIESVSDRSDTETITNTDDEAQNLSDEIPDNGGIETDGKKTV